MQIRVFQVFISAQLKANASLWSDNELGCGSGTKLVPFVNKSGTDVFCVFVFLTLANIIMHVLVFFVMAGASC